MRVTRWHLPPPELWRFVEIVGEVLIFTIGGLATVLFDHRLQLRVGIAITAQIMK